MALEFGKPIYLLLLIPAIYWIIQWYRKSYADLSPIRRWSSFVLRILVILFLCCSLAGLRWIQRSENLCVLYLVDLSQSVQSESRDMAKSVIQQSISSMKPADEAGVIVFGGDAVVESSPQIKPKIDKFASVTNIEFTDIGKALQLAMAVFPKESAKRVVLISDGNENLGNALDQAVLAKSNGIEVDTVPVGVDRPAEVSVENLVVPGKSQLGEPLEVKAIINSNINTRATIRLFRNGTYITSKDSNLSPGKNLVSFIDERNETGITRYEVLAEPQKDTFSENNLAHGYTVVSGEPRVLLVSGNPSESRSLYSALATENIKTDLHTAQNIPFNMSDLANYDVCIFDNVSALTLDNSQMKLIQSYVRDMGGGFVMVGGEDSFGLGGYYRTPIEETLPVDMDLKSKKYLPSMAMTLIVDKSGSMGEMNNGVQKIDMARQAALVTMGLLRPDDQVGVLAFDHDAKWIVNMQNAGNTRYIQDQVATLRAGGGTDMYPALVEAEKALNGTSAKLKHAIVMSDGRSVPGDFEGIVRKMVSEKITVSMVAVGSDADIPMMTHLAQLGKGRYYFCDNIQNLPRIFTKETLIASRSYLVEEPFIPQEVHDSPAFRGLDASKLPLLLGYVATTPKPRAEVYLVSHKKDPIYAQWQYGLGKAVAFTSDDQPRWAADWIRWKGFNKFWSQAIRWILRTGSKGVLHPQIEIIQGKGKIVVDALDDKGQFINFLDLDAQVVAPNLETQSVKLNQVSPGRYEGWFDAKQTGTYIANLSAKSQDGKTEVDHQLTGASMSYSPEYKQLGVNEPFLRKLSEVTNGVMITDPTSQVFKHNIITRREPQDASQWLLMLALILFTIDIFIRRLLLTREQFAWADKFLAKVKWKRKPKPVEVSEPYYARLRQRKAEVRAEKGLAQQPVKLEGNIVLQPETAIAEPPAKPAEPSVPSPTEPAPQTESSLGRLLEAKKRARTSKPSDENNTQN